MLLTYLKTKYDSSHTLPIGLVLISVYFIINGCWGGTKLILNEEIKYEAVVFSIGLLFSGIGLFFKKGWAWNFSIFFNTVLSFSLLGPLVIKIIQGQIDGLVFAGILSCLIMNLLIFIYLLKKEIRIQFPKCPISLFGIGFFLIIYGQLIQNSNPVITYFWMIMFIIGLVLVGKAGKLLRKELAQPK